MPNSNPSGSSFTFSEPHILRSRAMARSSQTRSSTVTRALAILLCVLFMVDSFATAATSNVGGRAGWTLQRYGQMNLRRGDALAFNYNPKFHNVVQVSQEDYIRCLVPSRPIKKYSSGKDSIKLSSPGTFYFLCGIPGHCRSGMKVAVTVR